MWSLPARLLVFLLLVEVGALAVVVAQFVLVPPVVTTAAWWNALALVVAGVVHTEVSLGIERSRRSVDSGLHIDLGSVWTFAAAALLPAPLATAVVVVVYTHLSRRARRAVPVHRVVFSTATVVLAVHTASAVLRAAGMPETFRSASGLLALLLALLAYTAVNLALVAVALLLGRRRGKAVRVVGHRDELLLELATLAMGVVVAGAMASFGPAYVVLVIPPLIVLHRTVLVRQLEVAATTDGKTGLLNAAAWRLRAEQLLRAARRVEGSVAVLLLDLDHFKLVNDNHGHLAGDQVLATIASVLRSEVRDDDLVGRFGGEEFVIMLAGADGEDLRTGALQAAERIRQCVERLRPEVAGQDGSIVLDDVTVSIGGATFPTHGHDLDRLLEVADVALYAAKRSGRNAVRMGAQSDPARS